MSFKRDKPKTKMTIQDVQYDIDKRKAEQLGAPKKIYMNENVDLSEIKWDRQSKKIDDQQKLIDDLTEKTNLENEKTKFYNDNLHKVDISYVRFSPINDILIRAFVKPLANDNGLIIFDFRDKIPVLANSANTPHHFIDNPYNYQPKGLIVSVPDNEKFFSKGQIVSIPQSLVRAPIPMNDYLEISYGFTHPDYFYLQPPTNKEDMHFGYLLIPRNLIKGFLNEIRDVVIT